MKNDFKMLQGPKKIKIRMPQYSHGAWTAKFLYFKYHLSDEELNKKKKSNHLFVFYMEVIMSDHKTFPGNCPPTPPLSQHFALSER